MLDNASEDPADLEKRINDAVKDAVFGSVSKKARKNGDASAAALGLGLAKPESQEEPLRSPNKDSPKKKGSYKSKFIEGSMRDRRSLPPPAHIVGEDLAMKWAAEDEKSRPSQDLHMPFTGGANAERPSSMYAFGNVVAGAWKNMNKYWWSGLAAESKAAEPINEDPKVKAERIYAELKNNSALTGKSIADMLKNGDFAENEILNPKASSPPKKSVEVKHEPVSPGAQLAQEMQNNDIGDAENAEMPLDNPTGPTQTRNMVERPPGPHMKRLEDFKAIVDAQTPLDSGESYKEAHIKVEEGKRIVSRAPSSRSVLTDSSESQLLEIPWSESFTDGPSPTFQSNGSFVNAELCAKNAPGNRDSGVEMNDFHSSQETHSLEVGVESSFINGNFQSPVPRGSNIRIETPSAREKSIDLSTAQSKKHGLLNRASIQGLRSAASRFNLRSRNRPALPEEWGQGNAEATPKKNERVIQRKQSKASLAKQTKLTKKIEQLEKELEKAKAARATILINDDNDEDVKGGKSLQIGSMKAVLSRSESQRSGTKRKSDESEAARGDKTMATPQSALKRRKSGKSVPENESSPPEQMRSSRAAARTASEKWRAACNLDTDAVPPVPTVPTKYQEQVARVASKRSRQKRLKEEAWNGWDEEVF
ncbi:MAG: hypothetical protein LQ340_003247 [Diploschistes diacapsis]|nr:MAG: hypothetical protein LQ340_003247 [Diploschistes diacapsis]